MSQIYIIFGKDLLNWISFNGKAKFFQKMEGVDIGSMMIVNKVKTMPMKMIFLKPGDLVELSMKHKEEIEYLVGKEDYDVMISGKEISEAAQNALLVAYYSCCIE